MKPHTRAMLWTWIGLTIGVMGLMPTLNILADLAKPPVWAAYCVIATSSLWFLLSITLIACGFYDAATSSRRRAPASAPQDQSPQA